MRFLDLKTEAFGLDINDSSLKAIKLRKKQDRFFVDSLGEIGISEGVIESGVIRDEKSLVSAIREARMDSGKKIRTKYVVASLPEKESFLVVVQMPKMKEEELKKAVIFEAENYIPLPVENVYLDYQIIKSAGSDNNHLEVLVAATPKSIVDSYVACIKSAGLIPVALEIESQAIARALVSENNKQPLLLIDVGEKRTDFIVYAENSIRFADSAPISKNQVNSKDAKYLKKDFIGSVRKYLDFYQDHAEQEHFSRSQIEKIIISGRLNDYKSLTNYLSKELGVLVEKGNPFANLVLNNNVRIDPDSLLPFSRALGLAIRGVNL
jgi:type IV pilus assembly protein PilM